MTQCYILKTYVLFVLRHGILCNFLDILYELVPDDTVHIVTTPPLYGTRCRLILDICIDSYSTNCFYYSFSIFYSTVETVAGYRTRSAAPTPNGR